MKTALIALALLLVTAVSHAKAGHDKGPTSVDWLLMNPAERAALVNKLVSDLQAKGVPLSAPHEKYAAAITAVVEDPKLKKETPVSNILMSVAYMREPAVRKLLDAARARKKAAEAAPAAGKTGK